MAPAAAVVAAPAAVVAGAAVVAAPAVVVAGAGVAGAGPPDPPAAAAGPLNGTMLIWNEFPEGVNVRFMPVDGAEIEANFALKSFSLHFVTKALSRELGIII